MHRLFVAVDPPADVSARLHALKDDALDARWVPEGNHHLTLQFIGAVEAEARDRIVDALTSVSSPEGHVTPSGISVFPSWRRPSVLVVLAEPEPALMQLQALVEKELQNQGIEREKRPFRPHITLARLKRTRPAEVRAWVRARGLPDDCSFGVRAFRLYESTLRRSGAEYTCLREYSLH